MSATTSAATRTVTVRPVGLGRVLRSEWIKLWSLRSTYWTIALTLLAMLMLSLLMAVAARAVASDESFAPAEVGLDGLTVLGTAYGMAQLVIAVLGVLVVTGEYSTGMIRSSLTAVPTRLPVLAAKAVLVAVVSFVVGVVGIALAYVLTMPMLADAGGAAELSDPDTLRMFWGTGLYLAAVGLFGLAIGTLVRHSAGAIAVVVGILLILPTVLQVAMNGLDWLRDIYPYLPTTAGDRIITAGGPGEAMSGMPGMPELLDPWVGYGVFMVYVVVALLAAALLLRRRDA
ncbi:ABC-2 type transport system permease protein [Georgenia satyanarayanai]|uniref:ABC-2 type transport system permease protein n=1 Tax=Georgenia satyanarayanai TaxID=860221 RepID=A0A2Y9A5F1_9MICO|nr:ABC transporter permease subunit [Georgenia satyanarayanai]PYG00887.1 ABC-2 type transport system permease protein [Georgenia satyanarayanai]SSA39126.1 ABC-2 type transport system permease protein [Georgenia satyanarayanai]